MTDPLNKLAWLALPKELQQKAVAAYREHDKAVSTGQDEPLWEAEYKCAQIDKAIHKALGLDTRYFPENGDLKTFVAELRSMVRKGYDLFQVDEPDPMMKKIEFHMQKFDMVKGALMKIAMQERTEELTR